MLPSLSILFGFELPAYGICLATLIVIGIFWSGRVLAGRPNGAAEASLVRNAILFGIVGWVGVQSALFMFGTVPNISFTSIGVLVFGGAWVAFSGRHQMARSNRPGETDAFCVLALIGPRFSILMGLQFCVGNLLAGRTYGEPTDAWYGVVFAEGSAAYDRFGALPLTPLMLLVGAGYLIPGIVGRFWTSSSRDCGLSGQSVDVAYISMLITLVCYCFTYSLRPEVIGHDVLSIANRSQWIAALGAVGLLVYWANCRRFFGRIAT